MSNSSIYPPPPRLRMHHGDSKHLSTFVSLCFYPSEIILRKILDCTFMASEEREPITGVWWGLSPPEAEGVLAFECQKEIALFSVFC